MDPNTSVTPQRVISLPGGKACVSRRAFRVRIRAPRGVKVRTARVYVNQRLRGRSKGSKATINLRGLPKGTFRVKVRAKLANGRTLTLKRTYRTCAPKTKRARRG